MEAIRRGYGGPNDYHQDRRTAGFGQKYPYRTLPMYKRMRNDYIRTSPRNLENYFHPHGYRGVYTGMPYWERYHRYGTY
jgi:hypothetical protein